jgi:tRNA 2-thiouridine synthesizing protein D
MHFAIHITAAPQHDNALRAWRYTDACLSAGHSVVRVFFSGAAVAHGNRLNTPGRDETGLTQRWQTLAKAHGVELIICVAAALRHGVLDEENASRWEQPSHNLAEGFNISGLGQLADAMLQADRYVCFSD